MSNKLLNVFASLSLAMHFSSIDNLTRVNLAGPEALLVLLFIYYYYELYYYCYFKSNIYK